MIYSKSFDVSSGEEYSLAKKASESIQEFFNSVHCPKCDSERVFPVDISFHWNTEVSLGAKISRNFTCSECDNNFIASLELTLAKE